MMSAFTARTRVRELWWAGAVLPAVLVVLWSCPVARAELAIEPGSFQMTPSSDQAGAHADLTVGFKFVTDSEEKAGGSLRHTTVELPPGFVGAPVAAPTCTLSQLAAKPTVEEINKELSVFNSMCPISSQVGTTTIVLNVEGGGVPVQMPVYNIVPARGQTAVFAFDALGLVTVDVVFSVRPGDYGVTGTVKDISGSVEVLADSLTIWGVPADPSHDAERNAICIGGSCEDGGRRAGQNATPFLTNPSECTSAPLTARLRVSSWQGSPATEEASAPVGPMTGCESLQFDPTMSIAPTTTQADSPAGYTVRMNVPQNQAPHGLGTSSLRDAVVTLPAGTALSPSAATGLLGCQASGPEGINIEGPESFELDQYGDPHTERGKCPPASELGTVKIVTPLVAEALEGRVYLAQPQCGGAGQPQCTAEDSSDGKLFGVYLEAEGAGAIVKLDGHVSVDPVTGQITTAFDQNPQLPFSEFQLNFFGGPRSPLANPRVCGEALMTSKLTPYSSLTPQEPFGSFTVTGCEAPHFAPSFTAGATSNQAGGYTPLSVTFSRQDLEGELGQVSVTTPPGLVGMLSHVTLCPEPQAAQGECSPASQIGEVTASAGPGPEPFYVSGGKVFITGPYAGAPYGLSIVEPAVAGPFNLGNVVVRGAIHVDPHTAALTITSEPLPTVKDGILLQIKTVHVDINRPEFVFNPTDCNPMTLGGTLASTNGLSSTTTNHFQVTNCAALGFKPQFKVSTSGKTSRANGASLSVKLTYPNIGGHSVLASGQANIRSVKVDLPKQLPSRLTTLQKACAAATFNADPASCPSASKVGTAKAITPILPVPLTGPAYFVSHGGEEFPSLIVVLQGYGVTVDLVGTTFISKAGITSSTFKTVPDVPVGTFELKLPQGKYSALAANGNLCKSKLKMPTAFVAQNGAVIHESTPIGVMGCPKVVRHARKKNLRKKK
jgi:hypothetical protein